MAKRSTKMKKPSDEQPALHMIIEKGRLVPAFPLDFERLDSYRDGTKMLVWMATDGGRPLVRRWFATIGNYIKHTQVPWGDRETASAAIKLALAMVVPFKTHSGQWSQYPRSLNDLDDAELEGKILEMEQLFLAMTGVDVEELRRGGNFGDEPFETSQPANDAGNETLAGDVVPPIASEEDAGAGQTQSHVLPEGTGVTETTEQRENVLPQREGQSSSEPPEQQRDTTGVTAGETAQDSPGESGPAPDDGGGADTPAAPPPTELSAEERVWLKQGAKMMLACLPSTDPESLRVLITQANSIKMIAPDDPSDATLNRMQDIFLHCKAVCKGEIKLDKAFVARTALASLAEVEPDKVKVRN